MTLIRHSGKLVSHQHNHRPTGRWTPPSSDPIRCHRIIDFDILGGKTLSPNSALDAISEVNTRRGPELALEDPKG